jgi:hypothetical protein
VLQPLETDPALCTKRDTHGHTLDHITRLATTWEPAPAAFTLLDARPLLQGKLMKAGAFGVCLLALAILYSPFGCVNLVAMSWWECVGSQRGRY